MRVWIDMTAPAHVLVFKPLIEIMRGRGDEVEITARDYAQTLQLLELHGLEADAVMGRHAGRSRLQKARQMTSRLGALRKWARPRGFDVALAHGSHELTISARRLGIPSSTTFDYEFATLQHQLGCRAATRVVVPDAIPPERLKPYGVRPPKLVQYPGLKEEYYLADFEPDRSLLDRFGVDPARVLVVLRPPPDVSLYHRHSNPLFPQTLEHLGRSEDVQAFVLPRTEEQREYVKGLALPSVILPGRRRRRAEPDRARRPRRLGGRDDEPRGGRARRARLHDVRRQARRRRRAADPRRPPQAAHRPARARAEEARPGGGSAHPARAERDAPAAALGPRRLTAFRRSGRSGARTLAQASIRRGRSVCFPS